MHVVAPFGAKSPCTTHTLPPTTFTCDWGQNGRPEGTAAGHGDVSRFRKHKQTHQPQNSSYYSECVSQQSAVLFVAIFVCERFMTKRRKTRNYNQQSTVNKTSTQQCYCIIV